MSIEVISFQKKIPFKYRLIKFTKSLAAFFIIMIGALATTIGLIATIMHSLDPKPYRDVSESFEDFESSGSSEMADNIIFQTGEVFIIAIGVLLLGIFLLWFGKRLKRGKRELVLYLRKFGFDSSTKAITKAITIGLGKRWRIVTLDDSKTAPVGVSVLKKALYSLTEFLPLILVPLILYLVFQGIEAYVTDISQSITEGATQQTLDNTKDEDFLTRAIAGIFGGIFSALIGALIAVMIGIILLALISIPIVLLGGIAFFSAVGSSLAIVKAEKAKSVSIQKEEEIEPQLNRIIKRSKGIMAPRLIIAHVSSLIWKKVIHAIDDASQYIIIDVSNPTSHLMWEIENMQVDLSNQIVYIGKEDHLGFITDQRPLTEPEDGIKKLLDGETIISYGTLKRRSINKFSRALRRRMEWLQHMQTSNS